MKRIGSESACSGGSNQMTRRATSNVAGVSGMDFINHARYRIRQFAVRESIQASDQDPPPERPKAKRCFNSSGNSRRLPSSKYNRAFKVISGLKLGPYIICAADNAVGKLIAKPHQPIDVHIILDSREPRPGRPWCLQGRSWRRPSCCLLPQHVEAPVLPISERRKKKP